MDAAAAARMSDPDRNRQFSRRWDEPASIAKTATTQPAPRDQLGTLGVALLDAFRRKRSAGGRGADPDAGGASR